MSRRRDNRIDFQYSLDIAYDDYKSCQHGDDCCDNDYCRCGEIQDTEIKSINHLSVLNNALAFGGKRKFMALELYALERLCARLTPDDFDVCIRGGYYGQEIDSVVLLDESPIRHIFTLTTPTQWVEYALTQEYGHVLDRLQGREWEMVKMPLNDICRPKQYRDLNSDRLKYYKKLLEGDKSIFLSCLCDEELDLVDGYHRLLASEQAGKQKIWVVKPRSMSCPA